jgi:Sulfotransferase family
VAPAHYPSVPGISRCAKIAGGNSFLRPIIVHYHIFKNAGSSLDRILRDSFQHGWASLEGPTPTSLLRAEDLTAFVEDHPTIRAVSSHLLRPPAPAGLNVLPVVLIRHPLDRAFSVYSQLRRNPARGLLSEVVARQSSFSQFVLWCLDNKSLGGMVIANYQVIHLSPASFRYGHIYKATATADDFRYATDFLSGGPCFGTVECFDAVMLRLHQAAGAIGLHLDPVRVVENVTEGRAGDLQERLLHVRQEFDSSLHDRYRQENAYDYELYEWVSKRQAERQLSYATSHRLVATT